MKRTCLRQRILHLAFGTFLRLQDPTRMFGDREIIANRWKGCRSAVLTAHVDGKLAGSNVVSKWGTFGWIGPLSIRPDLWDKGIAKKLMEPTMDLFSVWGTTLEGLFTFADSPKHIGLYQKFGFYPHHLTAIMSKKKNPITGAQGNVAYQRLSKSSRSRSRDEILKECQEISNSVYSGLDVSDEIRAVLALKLGDTILVRRDSRISGFAVCHVGPNSEAGSGNCYIKFGMSMTLKEFQGLLNACQNFAFVEEKVDSIEAGVNLARSDAYKEMIAFGFRTEYLGVAMQRPANEAGFNRQEVFAIDDWR